MSTTEAKKDSDDGEQNESFDWDAYLSITNSVAAPSECFCQAPEPPENSFDDGMIIEAYDSRFPSIRCAAEVMATYGPKIRLRMVGAGDNDDIWTLVDSAQIKPIGTAQNQCLMLQPPFNCRIDVSRFSKALKHAMNTLVPAPKECFVPEPPKPSCNKFQVGQKLEACDSKNPVYICPATVKEFKEDKILVEFDGWNVTEWFRFDSRDLFPVGWWEKSGTPIQRVPLKRRRGLTSGPPSTLTSSGRTSTTPPPPPPASYTKSREASSGKNAVVKESEKDAKKLINLFESPMLSTVDTAFEAKQSNIFTSCVSMQAVDSADDTTKMTDMIKPRAKKTISSGSMAPILRSINQNVQPSPRPKNSDSQQTRGNNASHNLDCIIESVIAVGDRNAASGKCSSKRSAAMMSTGSSSSCKVLSMFAAGGTNESSSPRVVDVSSTTSRTAIVDSPPLDGTPETSDFSICMNVNCTIGRFLDSTKLINARNTLFGPGGLNHVMRCCLQTLVDCANAGDVAHVLKSCCFTRDCSGGDSSTDSTTDDAAVDGSAVSVAKPRGASLSANVNGATLVRRLPVFHSTFDAWKYLSCVMDRLQTCSHLLSRRFDTCAACEAPTHKKAKVSPAGETLSLDASSGLTIRTRHISGGSSSSTCTERDLTASGNDDLTRWTVDDVVRFVYHVSDTVTADLFKKQEIDGKALLLLTADMMIRYMNVRLGPALKIANAIEKAKGGQSSAPSSSGHNNHH